MNIDEATSPHHAAPLVKRETMDQIGMTGLRVYTILTESVPTNPKTVQ